MPTTLTFLPNFTFTKTMTSSSSLESFMTIDNQSKNKAHKIIWTWTEFTICFDDRESKEKLHIWKMPQILKCFYLAKWLKINGNVSFSKITSEASNFTIWLCPCLECDRKLIRIWKMRYLTILTFCGVLALHKNQIHSVRKSPMKVSF